MTIIELNKRYYTIPTSWDELSKKQLLRCIDVLHSDVDVDSTMLQLLRILTGISWVRFLLAPMEEKVEFFYLCYFLMIDSGPIVNIIKHHKKFLGPADDFNNITGDEFIFTEDHYLKFVNSEHKDITALNELVAILYRPAKRDYDLDINPDGDGRQSFNQNICSFFGKTRIKKWKLGVKLAIFHWYLACREKMISENQDIFTGGNNEPAKYGLLSVMRTIAETGIHGDFEKVQKMYVKMWMMELNEKMEEGKKVKGISI